MLPVCAPFSFGERLFSSFSSLHMCMSTSRSEGMFLLLEIKDGDVVIPDFLGRLGLLTSCVLCPAAKVYYCCRVLLCQRNVTVDSGLCSGVWGSLLNTPGLDCGVCWVLVFPEKFVLLSRGALMFSACWSWFMPSPSHGGALQCCCPVNNWDQVFSAKEMLLWVQMHPDSLLLSSEQTISLL